MCFGNTTVDTKNTTYQTNPAVASAADQSLQFAQNLQSAGYTPYTGDRVADFSPIQQQGFNDAFNMVSGTDPFYGQSAGMINNYADAAAPTVTPNTIASAMGPYMNQYVSQALAPQIQAQDIQFANQNKQLDAAATMSGAFGDDRAGIEAANLTNTQDIARTGLIGQAYTNAFNTAIGAGAQDVGNNLQASMFNANQYNNALSRQLTGSQALEGLYGTYLSDTANQYGLSAQAGGTQQQQAQALLNVPYSNYLAAQQYPFLTEQMLNSAIGAGATAFPASSTTTDQKPDNSGFALGGAILGGFLSDERDKTDVEEIGKTKDGQKIYRFRYRNDPSNVVHIGFMAQDVEKKHPGAVSEIGGHKVVNYDRATAFSAAIGDPNHRRAA